MEKSLKKQQHFSSQLLNLLGNLFGRSAVSAFCGAAVCFSSASAVGASTAKPAAKAVDKSAAKPSAKPQQTETYQNLIEKAQNLSLQRDRLQASQILSRAIVREPKNSPGYKELTRSLEDLMSAFYTERAQSVFVSAEANLPLKPREAIEGFTEALRLEDGNLTVLKALARTHLGLAECDKADGFVKAAEALDASSPEVQLLRLQVMDCTKSTLISALLFPLDPSLKSIEWSVRGLQMRDLVRREEDSKAKALLTEWSVSAPEYPEVYFWKWTLSKAGEKPDRTSAQRYSQLCQNLTPRKRKSYNLDVDLCKGKEAVDTFLKEPPHEE